MKRKVLCVFSLVAWVLVTCTLLSSKIEDQMTAQVVTASSSLSGPNLLSLESLSYDGTDYHLFEMEEGTGWESGWRAREVSDQSYSIIDDEENNTQQVSAYAGYNTKLIQFSSRALRDGELVDQVIGKETEDDLVLAIFPASIPEIDSPQNLFELESRTNTALLLSVSNAVQPFMESRVRSQLYQVEELRPYIHPMTASQTRVYSITDVEQFLDNMPRLALLLLMLLSPVALWAASLIVSRRGEGRGIVLFNVALTVVDASFIPKVLRYVDLPSSLLPEDMIFNFGHYISEFSQVFDTLKKFEDIQLVQTALQTAKSAQHITSVILLTGILLTVLVTVVENSIHRQNSNSVALQSRS